MIHSAQSSESIRIQETQKPVNQFKQQIILCKNIFMIYELIETFENKRHLIECDTVEN